MAATMPTAMITGTARAEIVATHHCRAATTAKMPTIPVAYCLGVSDGAACELEGLPSSFAGLLPYCALSGLFAERKGELQSDQPEDGQSIETAECRFRNWRGRHARRHGARLLSSQGRVHGR